MQENLTDQQRVMKYAAWTWLAYLVAQALVDGFMYAGRITMPLIRYHLVNMLPALLFCLLAVMDIDSRWPKIGRACMLLLITIIPIFINHLTGIRLPPAPLSNIEGMVIRQLPVLMIAVLLLAWHMKAPQLVAAVLAMSAFDVLLVFMLESPERAKLTAFLFTIIIRAVCFIVVGIFTNRLIVRLRQQQASLKSANDRLRHHASTLETLTLTRERNRMSRELHDTVVHSLSGLSVQLETACAYWDVDPATTLRLLEQSLEQTRNGLRETRRALKSLRAAPLEDLGLVLAMRQFACEAAERGKLELELSLPEHELFLAPDVEQCLYRILQEAVQNAVHHAVAAHLTVRLSAVDDRVELSVADDGIGFDTGRAAAVGHYGMAGMQERADLVGGRLYVTSRPGKGTEVNLLIEGCAP